MCYTLEDVVRGATDQKVKHETAIPAGTYPVLVDFSTRFQQLRPLYLNVPGFSNVRLHFGKESANTSGCTLVGMSKAKNFIGESRKAYALVFPLIKAAYDAKQKITIQFLDVRS